MILLEPRPQPSRLLAILSPVIAIALMLVSGSILLLAMGKPPLEALLSAAALNAINRARPVTTASPLTS